MNRLGLKIGCVIVSVVIWIQVAATSIVEQSVQVPLNITGLAHDLTLAGSDVPESVAVRVRGSKLRLLTHNFFNRALGEVRVNLGDRTAGPFFSYEISETDVFTDLDILSVHPPVRLRLRVDHEIRRRLPVRLVQEGNLPVHLGLLLPLSTQPDSIFVTGPERFFPPGDEVFSLPVRLGELSESQILDVECVSPHEFLTLEPQVLRVDCRLAPLQDRTLANIPVIPLVDAGRPEVAISPPVADVMVRGVADSIQALTEARFAVTVAIGDRPEGMYILPGHVAYPDWLTLIGLAPTEFQIIVGQPESGDPTAASEDRLD